MDWNLLLDIVLGLGYSYILSRFYVTAQRRIEYRTGHELHWVLALLWGLLWPVWFLLWTVTAVVLPFEQRPASLLREPSKADRAAAALDRRKEERSLAIQDWQARASHWYALGQQAEREDDQALKWAVAENLTFLLETKPEGAQVKGLTETKSRETKAEPYFRPKKDLFREAERVVQNAPVGAPPKTAEKVDFCNICARYGLRENLTMEGVCNECAEQQGIR